MAPRLASVEGVFVTPPLTHNQPHEPSDADIVYFVNEFIKSENKIESLALELKNERKILTRKGKSANAKGISLEELKIARGWSEMVDQVAAREKPAKAIKYAKALGMKFKEELQGDLFESPYLTAAGTPIASEDEQSTYDRGFREATTGKGVDEGYIPEGLHVTLHTPYLKGQKDGINSVHQSFIDRSALYDFEKDQPKPTKEKKAKKAKENSEPVGDETKPIDWEQGKNDHIMGSVLSDLAKESSPIDEE